MKNGVRELGSLDPTEFENLIFDLAIAVGMVNVTWRTPGADGGRDIEAICYQRDASGVQTATKWFVECKRYASSVDWPTIYPKLAYADAASADFLMICTSGKVTPTAISNADQWNASRRYPKIRLWPGHEIENQLLPHSDIRLKYGISDVPSTPGKSIVALAIGLSKTVGSHYSRLIAQDEPIDYMLQAAHALSLLIQYRMEQLELRGRIITSTADVSSDLEGIQFKTLCDGIDWPSLSAFLAYLRALSKTEIFVDSEQRGCCSIRSADGSVVSIMHRYWTTFSAIALWGDLEIQADHQTIGLRQRT